MKGLNKRNLFVWSLYDFANSIVFITFFLYYSQWLVVDKGISDFWFNMTFVGSSILFLLTVPVAGAIADRNKNNLRGLRITTILTICSFFITSLIATLAPSQYVLTIFTFSIATYFYLFSFTYYHPLLHDVAQSEKRGLASGWGQFGNWAGEITGLLLAIPFATGTISLIGEVGRAQTFLPATILFALLALPMLLFFREEQGGENIQINLKNEYGNVFKSFTNLIKVKGVGLFLLAYFFFNDAVTTASNNFPIFVDKLYGVSDETKSLILVGILVTSMIGSPLSGWLADKLGHRKSLLFLLAGWIVIFPALALTHNFTVFVAITIIMGLWFGSIWTITRSYLMQLTPSSMMNQSFTYYTLMERLATFIGPISWGLIVTYSPTADALNYRLAAIAMAFFIFIGLLIARKLPEPDGKYALKI